jgi:diphthamide synthase (EF-2-diphthine--ammonia ligase)
MMAVFPLWGRDPRELAQTVIDDGFKAVVVCVDGANLDGSLAGRAFDRDFLAALPAGADPCGENGEYHTFVHDGPGFGRPVGFRHGETVHRPPFWYHDLLP